MKAFESIRALADAALLEGYVLYPYRSSSKKNRYRWTFGVLAPRDWVEAGGCEPATMRAGCLVEGSAPLVQARLRFLHPERRRVQRAQPDGSFADVEELEVEGELWLPWEEGEIQEIDLGVLPLADGAREVPFEVVEERRVEILRDATGDVVGRIVRERSPLTGRARIEASDAAADAPLWHLRAEITNTTPWGDRDAARDEVLRSACISTHLLLASSQGDFVSLLDPPPWARAAAGRCEQKGCFPVLAGDPKRRDLLLVSPIIMYDHPQLAPESPGDFFDSCEIDELLALRVATLTEDEKRQARATDPRSAAILERVEGLPPQMLERLHGAVRELAPVARLPEVGSKVRLAPGKRRTDAQDILYAGHVATVEKIMKDVDGQDFLAVTIDDDPAAELHRWYGRFHFYYPDEVERL